MALSKRKTAEVIKLFTKEDKVPYKATPRRQLATRRNWCYRMLACMSGFSNWMLKHEWLSEASHASLNRAIQTARYGVDAQWYNKLEELERKEAGRTRRRA